MPTCNDGDGPPADAPPHPLAAVVLPGLRVQEGEGDGVPHAGNQSEVSIVLTNHSSPGHHAHAGVSQDVQQEEQPEAELSNFDVNVHCILMFTIFGQGTLHTFLIESAY